MSRPRHAPGEGEAAGLLLVTALSGLNARETEVIVYHFCFEETLQTIGNKMHPRITGEAVRQVKRKALVKIKRFLLTPQGRFNYL